VPRLCEFYPGICLTTEEKACKTLSQGKKNLNQVKKNLSQSTVYILSKHPHITKPTQTQTLQNPNIHTRTHTHTLQNNLKPPQYKLEQTQCKVYPNEIVTILCITDFIHHIVLSCDRSTDSSEASSPQSAM
jgi:hypothetical protein